MEFTGWQRRREGIVRRRVEIERGLAILVVVVEASADLESESCGEDG